MIHDCEQERAWFLSCMKDWVGPWNVHCREKCHAGRPPHTVVPDEIDFALTLLPCQRKACVRRALSALRPRAGQWTRSRTGEHASLAWKWPRGPGGCRPGRSEVLSSIPINNYFKIDKKYSFILFALYYVQWVRGSLQDILLLCCQCSSSDSWTLVLPAYLISMSALRIFAADKILIMANNYCHRLIIYTRPRTLVTAWYEVLPALICHPL